MAETAFQPGQVIEGYRIEKQIGRGGMSELFLARDVILTKRVVIKILGPLYSNVERFNHQFLREARIQANLDNPHIVPIFRMFNHRGKFGLVMQYVKGTDLDKVVRKARVRRRRRHEAGALSPERAVHIFSQILEGIAFAHKYRIIHGDIKPSNILLDQQGRAKVADFGLSFLLSPRIRERRQILQGGTPFYMSPEQILDQKVDFRSDIYSLGVTLFHMVTGGFPSGTRKKWTDLLEFHVEGSRETAEEMLDQVGATSRIKAVVLKALENDPDDRHQSCLEFSLAIREDRPHEMYSELLRLSLLTKKEVTQSERAYLDKIAQKRGLSPEEAAALEINIRREMRLPRLDFTEEYRQALKDLSRRGKDGEDDCLDDLDKTYLDKDRVSREEALFAQQETWVRTRRKGRGTGRQASDESLRIQGKP